MRPSPLGKILEPLASYPNSFSVQCGNLTETDTKTCLNLERSQERWHQKLPVSGRCPQPQVLVGLPQMLTPTE